MNSGGFTIFEENLNYRTPSRLDAIFSKVNGNADAAALIAKGPRAIANRVYAGRNGNGNEASGDGFKYRGMGAIQLTGRTNYSRAADRSGLDLGRASRAGAEPGDRCQGCRRFLAGMRPQRRGRQ